MSNRIGSLALGLCLLGPVATFAAETGIQFSAPLNTKDPSDLHGAKGSIWYQPTGFNWGHFNVLFDASFGHWWVDNYPTNRELNILAVAPVFRTFILTDQSLINPFVDISLGPSYLSETRFADRNLGIHFSFQDQLGVGATFGPQHKLYASVYAVHYSNGSLCHMNAGITIPVMLNIGYRF